MVIVTNDMNYYKRWNPEKEATEFFEVWSEESFLDGTRIWRVCTLERIEGKDGKVKSEEFSDYDSFQKRIVHLHNTRIVEGFKRKNVEPILSLHV